MGEFRFHVKVTVAWWFRPLISVFASLVWLRIISMAFAQVAIKKILRRAMLLNGRKMRRI